MVSLSTAYTANPISLDVSSSGGAGSTLSSQAFQSELQQAFASALQQVGIDPSSIKLTFGANSGQNSGPNIATQQNSAASASAKAASPVGFNALIPATPPAAPAAQSNMAPTQSTYFAENAEEEAYWNAQPAAVQQLSYIGDQDQRAELASQLASQGYQVDVPIAVWGWDPSATMALRQQDGYKWVPAAGQQPVQMAPGLSAPGAAPYDPNNPPAGSIQVT